MRWEMRSFPGGGRRRVAVTDRVFRAKKYLIFEKLGERGVFLKGGARRPRRARAGAPPHAPTRARRRRPTSYMLDVNPCFFKRLSREFGDEKVPTFLPPPPPHGCNNGSRFSSGPPSGVRRRTSLGVAPGNGRRRPATGDRSPTPGAWWWRTRAVSATTKWMKEVYSTISGPLGYPEASGQDPCGGHIILTPT